VLYAYAVDGLEGGATSGSSNNGSGNSPLTGQVVAYPFSLIDPPPPISFTGLAFSRKFHGNGIGQKDLPLVDAPIGGNFTVEPRQAAGGHQIVFRFSAPVNSVIAVGAVDAAMAAIGSATPSFSGNDLIVTLTGVPDNVRLTVTASGVNGIIGLNAAHAVGFMVGDVSGSRKINAADIAAVKARQTADLNTGSNYLFDLNLSGTMSSADITIVKSASGREMP
jgi:hypothetical protein